MKVKTTLSETSCSGTKRCPDCEEPVEKSVLCFAIDNSTKDGLSRLCRDCNSERKKKSRKKLVFEGKVAGPKKMTTYPRFFQGS